MYKCKICGKKYTDINTLYNHITEKHEDMIPKDMSVEQYYYFMKTGKRNGNCVMCKQMTTWNKNTHKYNRFCGNPRCKEKYVEIVKGRMIAKYGKVHLLNDPNKQREMLANRKISGKYQWQGSHIETTYTGSYELDFLKTLDLFFDWDPEDISMPSPHTYTYEYEGEQKFYIPDAFIHSLELEIEIKDGGDNPNNHYKIQAVDKEKEKLKDETMKSQKMFHYVKLTNKNYTNFFDFLKEIKDEFEKYGDDKKIPRIFKTEDIRTKKIVQESYDILEENFIKNKINDFNKKPFADNMDFLNMSFELRKNNYDKLQDYFLTLAKNFNYEEDLSTIKYFVKKTFDHYNTEIRNNPDLEKEYYNFKKWVNKPLTYEVKDRLREIKESFEFTEESYLRNKKDLYVNFELFESGQSNVCLVTGLSGSGKSTLSNELCKKYNATCIEMDLFEHPDMKPGVFSNKNIYNKYFMNKMDVKSGLMNNELSEQEVSTEMSNAISYVLKYCNEHPNEKFVIEGLQIFADVNPEYIKGKPIVFVNTSMINSMIRKVKRDNRKYKVADLFKWYINDEKKFEGFKDEILEEKFEPDKFLIWFDKPIQKLKRGNIKVYHGSLVDIKEKEIKPINYNVGATKYSDPRWSTYVWDNREDALNWVVVWAVSEFHKETMMMGHNGKNLIGIPDGMNVQELEMQIMEKMRGFKFFVYECETEINNLEIGSSPSIGEYTVSNNLLIVKKYEYMINRELLKRFFKFIPMEELYKMKKDKKAVKNSKMYRGWLFNHILDNSRDSYRAIMRTDFQNGNIKHGDDLSFYKDIINHHIKLDTYGLKENCIYEASISLSYINRCLQNEYDELLNQYLQDYTDFYHRMLKERPDTVPHINDDIKRAIVFIDDLSKKGNVSNDLLKSAKWCLGDLVNLNKNTKPIKHSNHTQSIKGYPILTESFREDNKNVNIWVGADWHFYTKYGENTKENPNIEKIINNFNKKIKKGDIVVFVGDLYDARRIYNKNEMPKLDYIKKLKGHKIFVKGNHDVDPDQAYYDLGFNFVCTRFERGNVIFTHEPVEINENQINIHGHLHYCRDYWYVKPTSHVDVYTARFNYKPITLVEAIRDYSDGIKPLAIETFNKIFGENINNENILKESIESQECRLKVKIICNEECNNRQIFTLNDKSSQIIINEHYVIQRDTQGTNCSITQGQCDETNKKILEFDVVFNENINVDVLIKEKIQSGIQMNSLFNPNDMENRFIREMSLKLFGLYPDRCEMFR